MSSHPLSPLRTFMQICLTAAHCPGLCSNSGGGGDAGAREHQFGFSGTEGVGGCAAAPAADRAVIIVTTSAIHARFALFMSTPLLEMARHPAAPIPAISQ